MAAAIPLIGAGLSAYGAIQQGKMTSESLNQQADSLEAQAQESHAKGEYDAMRNQMLAAHRIGTSVAAYGASGVSAGSGSVLDVIQASHQNAELDRLNILHGADIRAINYMNQASMNRYGAESAMQGAHWKVLGALTGGAVKYGAENQHASLPSGGGGGEGAASASDQSFAESAMAAQGAG